MTSEISHDLIFDLGMCHGEDAEFYLMKGFRVVAAEANPALVADVSTRLDHWCRIGQLTIEPFGIHEKRQRLPFYVNLENDEWSAFTAKRGARRGTRHEIINVDTVPVVELIEQHGCPRYMKIDLEGADQLVVKALLHSKYRPTFVSVEEFGIATFDDLHSLGYDRFKIVPQGDKAAQIAPRPPKEGCFVERRFSKSDSGLFGHELPGPWLDILTAKQAYERFVHGPDMQQVSDRSDEWFDIHATRAEALVDQINPRSIDCDRARSPTEKTVASTSASTAPLPAYWTASSCGSK